MYVDSAVLAVHEEPEHRKRVAADQNVSGAGDPGSGEAVQAVPDRSKLDGVPKAGRYGGHSAARSP